MPCVCTKNNEAFHVDCTDEEIQRCKSQKPYGEPSPNSNRSAFSMPMPTAMGKYFKSKICVPSIEKITSKHWNDFLYHDPIPSQCVDVWGIIMGTGRDDYGPFSKVKLFTDRQMKKSISVERKQILEMPYDPDHYFWQSFSEIRPTPKTPKTKSPETSLMSSAINHVFQRPTFRRPGRVSVRGGKTKKCRMPKKM